MRAKTKQTVIINGRIYDAHTGQPVAKPQTTVTPVIQQNHGSTSRVISDIAPNQAGILVKKASIKKPATANSASAPSATPKSAEKKHSPAPRRTSVAAHSVHGKTQKSTTLRRDILKKPTSKRPGNIKKAAQSIPRSQHITKFAPHKEPEAKEIKHSVDPELIRQAEALDQAHAAHIKKLTTATHKPAISSRAVKEHLLKQHLDKAPDNLADEVHQAGKLSRKARIASVATTSLALILLGGYLTFINIPNLSIKVAAANAGINADLPQYQPNGYRIHGPITYTQGKVSVAYKENGSQQGYTITQKASDWDPQATLDNLVTPDSQDDYQIRSIQGLTVYTYDKKAVWVNGGILHTLEGDAPLSGQQVERIAASM